MKSLVYLSLLKAKNKVLEIFDTDIDHLGDAPNAQGAEKDQEYCNANKKRNQLDVARDKGFGLPLGGFFCLGLLFVRILLFIRVFSMFGLLSVHHA
mgnify:CR=1 FL=1